MRRLLFLTLGVLLLSSCISTNRLGNIVYSVRNDLVNTDTLNYDYISFDCSRVSALDTFVRTETLRSLFIPAIFYWQWNNDIKCEINPTALCSFVKGNILKIADSLHFKDKLAGRRIEISMEKIPNTFIYRNDGYTIIVLVAYMVGGQEVIVSQRQDFSFSYSIIENNIAVKSGKIIVTGEDKAMTNMLRSTKNFTLDYLDEYVYDLKQLSSTAMVQLKQKL